jgi:ClpP class serine protease
LDSTQPWNPDYYIASIFTHIHLQRQGTFRFAGFSSTVPFFKDALQKYGAIVHVYKHGPFKNAPNSLTERGWTKEHLSNMKTYLDHLNQTTCVDIASARNNNKTMATIKGTTGGDDLSLLFWKLVQQGGAFTATNALTMGFIDYICDKSPLDALLEYNNNTTTNTKSDNNNNEHEKEEQQRLLLKDTWGSQTNLERFSAQEAITFDEYRQIITKRKELRHQKQRLWQAAAKHSSLEWILTNVMGYTKDEEETSSSKEKIALLSVQGTISDKTVRKLAPTLRKIKYDKDVKCVIVQVDSPGGSLGASEALYQDFKDLPQVR